MKRFFWLALVITALRILYLLFNQRDLDVEESQYWTWSQTLALGYHSKPPMISWVIHFTTGIFGSSEWAIRLSSPLAYFCISLLLYSASSTLANQLPSSSSARLRQNIGFWTGISVLLVPGVTYSSTIISTDPLLILFWSLAFYLFVLGLQKNQLWAWLGCGVAIGLGLLSKYSMLFFFLSAGLYLLIVPQHRWLWKKPGPYLMIIIAALIFTPNILWNLTHHNAAVRHVIDHNVNLHGFHFHIKNLLIFILSQFGIFGPVMFFFFIIAAYHRSTFGKPWIADLLLCFSLPILFLILLESLLSRAYANWAALTYPSAIIIVVIYLCEKNRQFWLKFSAALHIAAALSFYVWELSVAYGWCTWPIPTRPNWHDFGTIVQQQYIHYPNSVFLTDSRELWSKTLYYGKIPRQDLFVWNPQQTVNWIDNPVNSALPNNKNFIFVTHHRYLPAEIRYLFPQQEQLANFKVSQRLRGRQDHIYVYYLCHTELS